MSQPATSSRLTNSAVNINGAANISTNYGITSIGVTGNNFDISALSTGNNISIGANGTRNVTIGSAASGTVTFPGVTTFTSPVNGGVFTGTAINGTLNTTPLTIGSNLTTGSVTIGAQSANTVTIGANSTGATGTVNVGTGSANINIGCTAASAIVLGKAGGSVTLGPALTLGAAPTTTAMLGGILNSTVITTTTGAGTAKSYNSIALTPGSWIIFGNITFPVATLYALMSIGGLLDSNELNYSAQVQIPSGANTTAFGVIRAVTVSSNTSFYLTGQTGSSITVQFVQFYAMRVG